MPGVGSERSLLELADAAEVADGGSRLFGARSLESPPRHAQQRTPPYSALIPVSYTHLRAHETPEHLVCRLLLEKKKKIRNYTFSICCDESKQSSYPTLNITSTHR
eukprot:TRINITY_DN62084_c0_g1_i1.p1 TRINITY_DN62084_c0_g1~~TRINITY_DN62084_c0_g1_i1.p1  ORF type:complete len:106 (+),score=5.91 TRINITY_DN62084_c0_g1_i1:360-677(+)